jgi:hypothetical protein
MIANKYIRFQYFADASVRGQETAQLEKAAQSHMEEWKFYIPTLKSGLSSLVASRRGNPCPQWPS